MIQIFFYKAYGKTTQDGKNQLWANTCDQEIGEYGHSIPNRCADALAKVLALDTRRLVFGCVEQLFFKHGVYLPSKGVGTNISVFKHI